MLLQLLLVPPLLRRIRGRKRLGLNDDQLVKIRFRVASNDNRHRPGIVKYIKLLMKPGHFLCTAFVLFSSNHDKRLTPNPDTNQYAGHAMS